MEQNHNSLFQLMRFNVLSSGKSNIKDSPFSSSYIFAWKSGVYPAFHEGAEWHLPFSEQFKVTENEVLELGQFLDDKWLAKENISFYELESHYGVSGSTSSTGNWDRIKLLDACRYMFLQNLFDKDFWSGVTENTKCPIEAFGITGPLKESDIYFM